MRKLLVCFLLIAASTSLAATLPRPDHIVVVIEENRSFSQVMGAHHGDSYIHALIQRGMLFTQSYAVTHPSQPNYLALFSGSTQGSQDDDCPMHYSGDNLSNSLIKKGFSFSSYSESLPFSGDTVCWSGGYQRKHNPAVNWQGTQLKPSVNLTFNDFPQDFSKLPTVSFVIPDQHNDMHDGSFATADIWLKTHLSAYVEWAFQHNSLLILTWDEDNGSEDNRIVTLLLGPMVKAGQSAQRIDHYSVLRTLLDFYGLPAINASREAEPIQAVWIKR